jgi:hypothetical protein
MKKVVIGYLFHRDKEWISLYGPDELRYNTYVKKSKAIWTKTYKCYLLPCTKAVAEKLRADLSKSYILDFEPLRLGLLSRKQHQVMPEKIVPAIFPQPENDFDTGLRDWEMRYQ